MKDLSNQIYYLLSEELSARMFDYLSCSNFPKISEIPNEVQRLQCPKMVL